MPKKNDVSERDENDFFDQRILQCTDGVIDQFASVVKRYDLDSFGQAALERCDLRLDVADDFAGIRAVADNYDAADGIDAALVEDSPAKLRPQLHRRNILNCDR